MRASSRSFVTVIPALPFLTLIAVFSQLLIVPASFAYPSCIPLEIVSQLTEVKGLGSLSKAFRDDLTLEQIAQFKTMILQKRKELDALAARHLHVGLQVARKHFQRAAGASESEDPRSLLLTELLAADRQLMDLPGHLDHLETSIRCRAAIREHMKEISLEHPESAHRLSTAPWLRKLIEERAEIVPEAAPYPQFDSQGQPLVSKKNDMIWKSWKTNLETAKLEGEVAREIADSWGDIVGMNEILHNERGEEESEIDIRMQRALVEVTTGSANKETQIFQHYFSRRANPHGLPVILYAPNYSVISGNHLMETALQNHQPLIVVHDFSELHSALESIYGTPTPRGSTLVH